MADLARRWWPLALIVLAALWLRTHELGRRPMHADEANQAVKAGELLECGEYSFDPLDHHGPTLYFAALPFAWARGEFTLADLSETSVRLVPAFFGTASVILLALLASGMNPEGENRGEPDEEEIIGDRAPPPWPALAAAAFMALSPPAVYYSRYFVQETLLVAFTLATFVCAQQWWRTRLVRWAVAVGAGAGLMQATKATAPLFLFAALLAVAVSLRFRDGGSLGRSEAIGGGERPSRPHSWLAAGGIALASALFVAGLFYSSFGTNPSGLVDAVRTYTHALARFGGDAPPTGHEKPWWYFLQLFGWQRNGGLTWHQLALSVLALAGFAVALARVGRGIFVLRKSDPPESGNQPGLTIRRSTLPIWAATYTVVIIAAFSSLAYKTPWHAVHFVPGLALLGACALGAVCSLNTGKYVAIAFALAVMGSLYQQTARAAFLRPADARNPYAYVHSSADVLKFRALAVAALAQAPDRPIRIISEEYWPLPWYLRGLPNVGYWSEVPEDCDGALVIASQENAEAVQARLRDNYRTSFLGLRPGFICILYTLEP
jgi:uncharacterized protein (TIGR03663 family)